MDIGPEIDRLIEARDKGTISERLCDEMIDDLMAQHKEWADQRCAYYNGR